MMPPKNYYKIEWFYLCELQVSLWYSLLDFGVSYGIFTPNKSDRSTLILSCLVSNRASTTAPPYDIEHALGLCLILIESK